MIVTFSVANFRSFDEEVTFSLVASRKLGTAPESHLTPIPGTDKAVLRAGVMYGANGAGKSNFFKALKFLQTVALRTTKKGVGTKMEPFIFGESGRESTFDLQFIAGDRLFRYGVSLTADQIKEEWLAEVLGEREKTVFERSTDGNGDVAVKAKLLNKKNKKLAALVTIGGPKEQSFLATIRATLERSDFSEPLRTVIEWFESGMTFVEPDESIWPLGLALGEDVGFRAFAAKFMRGASTGVDNLSVAKKEIAEEQLKAMLPGNVFAKVLQNTSEEGKAIVALNKNREILIEKSGEHRFFMITIQSVHEHETGRKVCLDLAEESDGTRRLLNLLPALHRMDQKDGVFVIDEIERSMHPLLVRKFVEYFLEACTGEKRQLIFTTHESSLLDQALLRRDEIWFTEKDRKGATKLYSLADFRERNDLRIDKHYLRGRFGAVPFLGDLDQMVEEASAH